MRNELERRRTVGFLLGALLLACGCAVYLLFRSKTIRLYRWCADIGLSDIADRARSGIGTCCLPDFVRYSLPDGLYCAAYILIVNSIWSGGHGAARHVAVCAIPMVAMVHELLQGLHFVNGTFDVADMLCYATPLVIYSILQGKR